VFHGVRIGTEIVTLARTGDGWLISATGHQGPPFDVQTNKFELTYADDWQPRRLEIQALLRGQPVTMTTTIEETKATNQVTSAARTTSYTQNVSPKTILLPNSFYASYEALAARLSAIAAGDRLPLYVTPDGEILATVAKITPRVITSPSSRATYRQFDLTFSSGDASLQIWVDDQNRLARATLPGSDLTVAREDLASVMTREELVRNSGDATAFIPLAGFSVAASVTSPSTASTRRPAVVLVSGFGPQDRDQVTSNVPVFGLLAGWLADDGYIVVRYDNRGVGQSGGRPENATLNEYAEDLNGVVDWLRRRKDVDGDRIAAIGYGDGGAVAMLAAAKQNRIRALGLVAVPGVAGREYVVEQQARALAALQLSEADKQAKIAMQQTIMNAAISGTGWDNVPADLRRGADQPIYKSWLLFDPAAVIPRIDQPILILQGDADVEVPRAHADRLATLARARTKRRPEDTRESILPGVTHPLTHVSTGPIVGVPSLAPDVHTALTGWLQDVFRPSK
jgi:pimeloyl-ACP methyl ester carboxylesterase